MLFYCILGEDDTVKARELRGRIAGFVLSQGDQPVLPGGFTPQELLEASGWSIDKYLCEVVLEDHWGGEVELIFLAHILHKKF